MGNGERASRYGSKPRPERKAQTRILNFPTPHHVLLPRLRTLDGSREILPEALHEGHLPSPSKPAAPAATLTAANIVEEKVLALQDAQRALLANVFEPSAAAAAKLSLADPKTLLK